MRATILHIDSLRLMSDFNERHFLVAHDLAGHPLFEIPRLLELATCVSAKWPADLYYDSGVTNISERWSSGRPAISIENTIANIACTRAWVDIKSAERDPQYARVLDQCIGDLLEISGRELKGQMRRTQMAIFITSPRRISTYHIDSECNFLLQVKGTKDISLFNRHDREVLPEEEIERSWAVDPNAAIYKPQLQDHADVVSLSPGLGVHIPVNAPHWVQNGPSVSVSVAILFHWWNRNYANVYAANYFLRQKLGRKPSPPFKSRLRDYMKQPLGAAFIRLRRLRHGPIRSY